MLIPEKRQNSLKDQLLKDPSFFIGKRVFATLIIENERTGLIGTLTRVDLEKKILVISYKDKTGQTDREVEINEKLEIKVL